MGIAWIEELDTDTEEQRYTNPDGRHDQSFTHIDLMLTFPAKRLQVDQQHDEDQYIERNPNPEGQTYHFSLLFNLVDAE